MIIDLRRELDSGMTDGLILLFDDEWMRLGAGKVKFIFPVLAFRLKLLLFLEIVRRLFLEVVIFFEGSAETVFKGGL